MSLVARHNSQIKIRRHVQRSHSFGSGKLIQQECQEVVVTGKEYRIRTRMDTVDLSTISRRQEQVPAICRRISLLV